MSNPGNKKSPGKRPPDEFQEPARQATSDSPAGATPDDAKRSGRIAHDERGNSAREWQLETGVYTRDISTQRLKKLDSNDLSIAETAKHPRPAGLGEPSSRKPLPGGGFNPYDNSSSAGGNVGNDPYNSAARGALKPEAGRKEPPARQPMDMKKLQEWIELRKRVEQNKREDDDG
jgi:hypothetical protein